MQQLVCMLRKTMTQYQTLACFLLLRLLLFSIEITGANVPAVIVFGDSTVDAGNNNQIPTLARGNFKPYGQDFEGGKPTGRFCNGRLATDFISEALGIKSSIPAYLDPAFGIEDFATGVTFASAGSGYDIATSDVLSVIPLWKQLEYFKEYKKKLTGFLGEDKATETLREALYIVSIGTNDFIENYFVLPVRSSQFTVDEYEVFLIRISEKFVNEIYGLGARKISVMGLPPSGCLPISRTLNHDFGRTCREDFNKAARDFNVKLQNLLANLREQLQGIKLVYSDLYNILLHIIRKPSSYGFENVSEGCCGTGAFELSYLCNLVNICTDTSKYIFWDSVHPTEKLYSIVADYLVRTSLAELF